MTWTLDDALALIRSLQPAAMESGWCLMLAGGVLNNGFSANDLDLLAYPRDRDAVRQRLLNLLPEGRWSRSAVSDVFHFAHDGKPVELIFQTWSAWRLY